MGRESHELASYFCADHQPGGFALWRRGGEQRPRLEEAEILDGMKHTFEVERRKIRRPRVRPPMALDGWRVGVSDSKQTRLLALSNVDPVD